MDGFCFIDADGKSLRILLNYLRGRILYSRDLLSDKETLQELRREVDFYNLLDLKDLIDISLSKFPRNFVEWLPIYFEKITDDRKLYQSKKYVALRKINASNSKF